MIKEIVKDPLVLKKRSDRATQDDIQTAHDLLDTVTANSERCVGMAANMIGVHKTILVALIGNKYEIMINPVILKSSGVYETEEGCLSLEGVRKTKRCRSIKLQYSDIDLKTKIKTFKDFEAQIIPHEMDHFEGILI